MPEHGEGNAHGGDGKSGGDEARGKHEKKLAEDQVHAGDGAGQDGLHGAAFFFPGGGVHAASQAKQNDHVADESAESSGADLFRGGNVVFLDFKGLQGDVRDIPGAKSVVDNAIAIFFEAFLDVACGNAGFQVATVIVDEQRRGLLLHDVLLESRWNFNNRANLLVDD